MSKLILNKLNSLQQLKQKEDFWNITWDQGLFLSNLVKINNPKRILEIGTSNGFSTLWLAKELSQTSTIDTIEVNEERFNIANANFNSCRVENIIQHKGEVFEVLPALKGTYDLVVVDAAQAFYKELIAYLEENSMLGEGSVLVFDNVLSHGNMEEFIRYMEAKYHTEIIGLGGGFLFAKKG